MSSDHLSESHSQWAVRCVGGQVRAGIVSNYVFISCHYLHIWAGQSISRYLGGFTIYTSEAPGCNTLTRPEQIEKWLTNFQTEQRYVPTTQMCIISEVIHKILMVIRFKLHKSQLLQVGLLDIKIYEPWPGQYNFFFLVTWYLTLGGVRYSPSCVPGEVRL